MLRYLERLHANNAPEFIYYLTLYRLFKDELEGKEETDEKLRETTLLESGIWRKLFGFQKDGAKGAINKLLRFNGCILADNRKLLPDFARLQAAGAFRPKPGDRDITDLISEERNERLL